jgi:hypothetical protein
MHDKSSHHCASLKITTKLTHITTTAIKITALSRCHTITKGQWGASFRL